MIVKKFNYPWGEREVKYDSFALKITKTENIKPMPKSHMLMKITVYNQHDLQDIEEKFEELKENRSNIVEYNNCCFSYKDNNGDDILVYIMGFLSNKQ